MPASVSRTGRFRAVFLSVIMVLMTQVGYTDNIDFSIGLDQDTESKDTGSSTPALTPSVAGADLMVDEVMDDITFQHETGTYNGNGTAWMVKDINTGSSYGAGVGVSQPIVFGNMMYFSASDGTNGKELWKSDGTEAGTVMVKDIWSGSVGGSMLGNWQATIGNTIYFPARDGISSTTGYGIAELWKTDGTASGTVLVKDIRTGSIGSNPSWLTPIGNTLYFSASDSSGDELWKSDGTEAGTVMVKNIYNITATGGSVPQYLTAIGNTFYFTANDGINGNELWKSDGTEAGTVMVKDINSGSGNSNSKYLIAIGNTLYFQADDGNNGIELWKSDGTASGTMMVKDINSGSSSGLSVQACDMLTKIEFNNMLYFRADDGTNGCELWKSDGTASGTMMVKDIYQSVSGEAYPQDLTANGDTFYFKANDGTHGYELWKSDGTASGTVMVKDMNNGSGNSQVLQIRPFGDTVYFYGDDGTSGAELWKSDGTEAGTVMVQDINSGSSSSWPVYLTPWGNTLYFGADDGSGMELWALDPANITGLSSGSGSSMTNFIGANCTVSPALPTGLSIDSSTCTISGTPSVATSNTTYTVTANISNVTYQGSVWLSSAYHQLTSSVAGADLMVGDLMDDITFRYESSTASGSGSGSSSSSSFAHANNKVAVGQDYTCAILDNGDLKCWGRNSDGQLGDGGTTPLNAPPSTPVDLGTGRTAVAVSNGYSHTCVILDNGELKCWGSDATGELGNGAIQGSQYSPSTTAIDLGSGRTAVAVDSGYHHTCAILDNGDLKCWGYDNGGQLGILSNGQQNLIAPPSTAIDLGTNRTAIAVSAGKQHTCAILDNGDLKCWGRDFYGQLGDGYPKGNNLHIPSSTAIDLGTNRTAVAVSAGDDHTCAILDNGDLKCWGRYNDGRLGNGTATYQDVMAPLSTAIDLGTNRTAVAVAAGQYHTCATLDNGDVKCWGSGWNEALGNGASQGIQYSPPTTAIDLGTNRTAVALATGDSSTCAILDNGDMKCWGKNIHGQLGNGGSSNQLYPVAVSGANTWDSSATVSSIIAVAGANCTVSPALPTGLSMDSSTCTISGTPSVATSNTTYTVTANISGTTYQVTVWLATLTFGTITSPVMGAELELGEAMTPITLNYTSQAGNGIVHNGNGTAWLVKDITPGTIGSITSSDCWVAYGDTLLFCAGMYGDSELYKSDGTANGTVRVKDIYPGGQQGSNPGWLVHMDETVYFVARNIASNTELWKTDGTEAGTMMVKDINTGTQGQAGSQPRHLTVAGNTLYFSANDGIHGHELWKSDGTEAGTVMVKDIKPGSSNGYNDGFQDFGGLEAVGNKVFFVADDGIHGDELWVSDGTANGTMMVRDIDNGSTQNNGSPPTFSANSSIVDNACLTAVGDTLFFCADDGIHSRELWKSDGTEAGTVMVKDIANNYLSVSPSSWDYWTAVGDTLFFVAYSTNGYGQQLWKSDGTEAGTVMVTTISSTYTRFSGLFEPFGDGIIFEAEDDTNGYALWKSDGTAAGTVMVKDINPDTSTYSYIYQASVFGNMLYFSGDDGIHGKELWQSDGTGSGTMMVKDIYPGTYSNTNNPNNGDPIHLIGAGTKLYFGALDYTHGWELWALDPANITLDLPPPVSWETYPALPAGMSISNGVISGTPSVYAVNQTYTIYANQSGETTTFDMYFSVDTNNPHTVVENQPIDAIGFQGPFQNGTTNWTVSPALPADLVMDPNTGEITGSVNGVLANTTYTVNATHSDGAIEMFTFSLQSLADLDGDGLPNELPSDYDAAEGPTPGLVADADDDGDGLDDVVETGTGFYINTSSTGTDPLDPDTDGDRICDGPNSIPNVCVAGPDTDPFNFLPPPTFFALEGLDIGSLAPYLPAVGGTYEISPDLPASLVLDSSTGEITGVPTENLNETTFTVWINMSDGSSLSWDFTMTVLKDTDGDGMPDDLPDDYDPSNPDSPGLIVDLDNDNDGILDSDETDTGTSPTDPDTDGDGTCDGPLSIAGICDAGPDAFPLDPSADTDTDGDGKPDSITGNSTSVPPLEEDMDDDGDGVEDVNETGTWTYNGPTDTGTNPLNPDTDFDGTCDGPVDVYHPQTGEIICVAGPDTDLGNLAVGAHYAVNGSAIETIRPEWFPTGAVWEVSPDLPADLTIDPDTGIISGTANEVTENITYTIYGNGTVSDYTSTFNLQVLEDSDRDGLPNALPDDYDNSTVTPMVEDLDDDNDGLSDLAETGTGVYNGTSDYGTDPLNPDTDGDGVCDGPNSIWPICINGPDSNPFGFHNGENIVLVENIEIDTPIQPPNQVTGAVWEISPALPAGLNLDTSSGIITGTATEVSNNVTYTLWANVSDFGRSDSVAISVMATFGLTVLEDSDGDGLPNELPEDYDTSVGTLVEDDDDDNDGMLDTEEDTLGTDPTNPDSDGDGFCDGPSDVYAADGTLVCRGPDSAPLDSALPVDTDGDMFPDEDPDGPGGLEADTDDDGDGHLDTFENDCGSDSLNATSIPQDMDGDEICDGLDEDIDGDGIFNILETNTGVYNSTTDTGTDPLNPDTDGDGICDGPSAPANGGCVAGADDFPFDPSASKDTDGDGMPDTLTGTSTSVPPLVEDLDDDDDGVDDELESDCDTDPLDAESVPTLNDDGSCKDSASSGGDYDGGFSYMWCFPCLLFLLLLLLVPLLIGRDRVLGMLLVGPEPENTISEPEFVEGAGTQEDPFILAPAEAVKPGESINSTEIITITNMTISEVDMMDFNQEINGDRFSMFETNINEVGTRIISVGDDGEITINMLFDDGVGEPTYEGGEFTGLLKLGRASVYLSWTVTVEPDKKKLKEIEKQRKADEKAAKKAEEAEAKRMAKEEAEAKKKAEEEAAAAAKEAEEEEAAAAAALLVKKEEEAEAKKKAEEEAAAAALLVKKEEEAAAKKKAKEEADAKKAKEAEEKAAAKKKADEEKAKKAEETAAAALLVKKEEEAAAKKKAKEEADAKKAKEAEEKAAAKKKADEEKAKKAEEAAAAAAAAKPVTKEAKKKEELNRVKANASKIDFKVLGTAKASEKDDLQVIKGIGPFIEEKLNALGIYTYRQISKMNSKLEDSVNLAIEFFPGRVKRDQWVAQAKILLGEDVKIDEKALKKAEELERVAKKAEKIDFGTIGVASASDKDNLQELKGIGPFIEEKLNALGIFKFVQIAKMTSKIEDEVNIAIEFFPGRVKRDEWVKQAKERTK